MRGGVGAVTKKNRYILLMMATGSPDGIWLAALNAATSLYRISTVHLEKGHPLLAGGDVAVVRVRRGVPSQS